MAAMDREQSANGNIITINTKNILQTSLLPQNKVFL